MRAGIGMILMEIGYTTWRIKKFLIQQPPQQPEMVDPPTYSIPLPSVAPALPAPPRGYETASSGGYWALDPATNRYCLLIGNRVVQWAPEEPKEEALQ